VTKLLKLLARAKLLESHRGLKGGYRLSRPAKGITVAEVITAISGPIAMTQCSDHGPGCSMEAECPTNRSWQVIDRVVRKALQAVTLDQMIWQKAVNSKQISARIAGQILADNPTCAMHQRA
jgi:Rrf2 family protein